jgi:hypothetical protein
MRKNQPSFDSILDFILFRLTSLCYSVVNLYFVRKWLIFVEIQFYLFFQISNKCEVSLTLTFFSLHKVYRTDKNTFYWINRLLKKKKVFIFRSMYIYYLARLTWSMDVWSSYAWSTLHIILTKMKREKKRFVF